MRIVMVEGAACMVVIRASIQAALLISPSIFMPLRPVPRILDSDRAGLPA